jgi:BASS family bile acid:Na+ symporter
MALRLGLLVGGCAGAALLTRQMMGRDGLARAEPGLEVFNLVCLVLFAIAVMDGVAAAMQAAPWRVLGLIVGAYAAALGMLTLTAAVFMRLGRPVALTLGYAAGNRNMALMMASLPTTGLDDVWLWFALVQFPIYTLPMFLGRPIRAMLRA